MIRDSDFTVDLPSETFDMGSISPEISYLRHTAGLSKIIGQVIDGIYRPGQAAIHLDQLLETIAGLDAMLLAWRYQLPPHLRFFNAHPFENNVMFKRQVLLTAVVESDRRGISWKLNFIIFEPLYIVLAFVWKAFISTS